ncbi:MAG TPA: hypothetical protein VEW95_09105 [Candidatus Limnocylindrales bacterium]|nr:hypothetical protein [Candidatus Limnocylindrales bacterium]
MNGANQPERRLHPALSLLLPAGFAAGYVLLSFVATPTPLSGLVRPLLIATGVSVVVAGGLALILRNVQAGGLVASILVLAISAPWVPALVLVTVGIWIVLVFALRRSLKRTSRARLPSLATATRMVGTFSLLFAVVSGVSAIPSAAAGFGSGGVARRNPDGAAGPDIVILLLDGYPRSDVLASSFGYDNAWFEAGLTRLGFEVLAESRSNYTATWATLASMLNGRYLQEMPEILPFPTDQAEQYVALMRAINESSLPGVARDRGYEVAWVESPFENASLTTADELHSGGQMTSFELSLLRHSPLLPVLLAVAPDLLLAQQRDRIEGTLAELPDLVADDETSTLAVAHVLSPHAPIVFAADGSLADPPSCLPDCSLWAFVNEEQWDQFPGQVDHLNEIVLDALVETVAANSSAVVVVMSDHGHRPPGAPEDDLLRSFTAVRFPGAADVADGDLSPVNLLPAIFNAYLSTNLPVSPYRAWISEAEFPLTMTPSR